MEWESYYKAFISPVAVVENQLDPQSYVLHLSGSYGDILPNLALFREFHDKYKMPISCVIPEVWRELTGRFGYPFVRYYFLNSEFDLVLRRSLVLRGHFFLREPGSVFPLLPTLHPFLGDIALSERTTDFEIKRVLLGLPPSSPFDIPPVDETRAAEIHDVLRKMGLERGNTVVISFNTNSNPTASPETQEYICDQLVRSGFSLLINSHPGSRGQTSDRLPGARFSIPPDCPFEVVEYCGAYLGSLHGLTNILGGMREVNAKLGCTEFTSAEPILNNNREISGGSLRPDRQLKHDLRNRFYMIPIDSTKADLEMSVERFVTFLKD
jgi:hypothetical protein